ncbi:transporter [Escherichia coli]|uniref:transporter n=1 Tax=Escherichia coli TaxID=562 RepID=UPI00186661A1|nr:transporter [Escherichia coli]
MADKVWRLTVFLVDGRETTVALYKDEGEALVDALLLAEDERVLGYEIEPVE